MGESVLSSDGMRRNRQSWQKTHWRAAESVFYGAGSGRECDCTVVKLWFRDGLKRARDYNGTGRLKKLRCKGRAVGQGKKVAANGEEAAVGKRTGKTKNQGTGIVQDTYNYVSQKQRVDLNQLSGNLLLDCVSHT